MNPNGAEVTACEIEYSTSPTLAGATTVSCGSPGSGTSAVPVSGGVSGLAPLTVYYYRVDASNAGSRGEGSIESFTTLPDPPTVLTGSASSVTSSSATLNGTVNPNDANVTACEIEYATSPTLAGETTASCGSPGAGTSAVAVSAPAGVLAPLTRYYFRVDAANAGGRTQGGISTFTTPALPPTVVVGRASAITHTGATLTGSVNPNGSNVTACEFEYGTTLPSPKSVPCIPAPGAGSAAVAVTAAVTGLTPDTTYQYRLVAMNAGGTGTSSAASFKTAALEPPELGRCVSVAAGHGRFSSSKCSSEGGKGTYEWEPGAAKAHVSLSGGAVKLETATNKLITCTGSSGEGSYGAFKELTDVTLTFTGCQTTAGKCSSAGAAAGEVRAATLLGTLVWTSKASKQVAWELAPSAGAPVLEMQCATTAVEVSGSLLVPVKTDKAGASSSLAFKASKGVQKPDEYEAAEGGTLKSTLEASFGAVKAEPIGLTTTLTLTGEEAIQISTTI